MSDDSYSIKEILARLDSRVELVVVNQSRIENEQTRHIAFANESLLSIDKHLEKLNSKVAEHEKQLGEQKSIITKISTIVGIGASVITLAISKYL